YEDDPSEVDAREFAAMICEELANAEHAPSWTQGRAVVRRLYDPRRTDEAVLQTEDERGREECLAVRVNAAAEALGISRDSFERYVQPDLKMLQIGTLKLVPWEELR